MHSRLFGSCSIIIIMCVWTLALGLCLCLQCTFFVWNLNMKISCFFHYITKREFAIRKTGMVSNDQTIKSAVKLMMRVVCSVSTDWPNENPVVREERFWCVCEQTLCRLCAPCALSASENSHAVEAPCENSQAHRYVCGMSYVWRCDVSLAHYAQ